jgi:hypothetical protein
MKARIGCGDTDKVDLWWWAVLRYRHWFDPKTGGILLFIPVINHGHSPCDRRSPPLKPA